MARLFILIALLFSACGAFAQAIPVRSGAHEGFARLVVRVPTSSSWSLQETEKGALLSLENFDRGFEISRVFDLIGRDYISDISATSNTLQISFGCVCAASAFVVDNNFVVIDVTKSSEIQDSMPNADLQFPKPIETGLTLFFPPNIGASTDNRNETAPDNRPNTLRISPRAINKITRQREIVSKSTSPEQFDALDILPMQDNELGDESVETLAEAQRKLAQRLAIAATRGILEPAHRTIELPNREKKEQIDTSIFDSSRPKPQQPLLQGAPSSANLRITTSSDSPIQTVPVELESTSLGVRCISPEKVAVEAWGTDTRPTEKVAEYRASLFSEFDRLNKTVAVDLARLYLHYGFGAEARQILLIDPEIALENPELVEIADIMEHGSAQAGEYLLHFADCSSSAALWGILAHENLSPNVSIDADAALRTVTGLPMHLRRFVAPKLSRRLLEHGDEARSETALRSLDRTAEPPTAQSDLARAELQLKKGETEEAQQTLAGIVSSNEQQSAEALIKFVDSHLQEDTLIDQSVATLVEGYALEMRGHPLGDELKRTHVLALAKSGQFDEAFDALDRIRSRGGTDTRDELHTMLVDILTRTADDVLFLERVFKDARSERNITEPKVSISVAERLLALGFPQQAETVLTAQDSLPNTSRIKEIRAKIALALGRALEAEAILFEVDTATASELRARARTMSSNHGAAAEIYEELGDTQKSMQSAWLAEDWSLIDSFENSPFSPVADLVNGELETSGTLDGMLGRMSEAIEESSAARSVIESLLRNSTQMGEN